MSKQGKDHTTVDQSHTPTQTILLQSDHIGLIDHTMLVSIAQHTHIHT